MKNVVVKALSFLFLISLLSSCMVMKPGATKSGKNLYETFFISIHTNQYFIKPLDFVSENNDQLLIDFTLRDKKEFSDSATVNFTLISDQVIKKVDSAYIDNGRDRAYLDTISHIYTSKKKEKYNSRFTSKSHNPALSQIFGSNAWLVNMYINNELYSFYPSRNTMKNIAILEENIFEIIRE